jgi:5-amino-6-(5-phosphoribosylamino)uracil reductase
MRIVNVMAVSMDGRIASHPDESDHARRALGFTNDDDRAHLERLLRETDAVIVGRSSLMASGGAWELPNAKGAYPIWAVLTNAGLPPGARFFSQRKIRRWLVSKSALAAERTGEGVRNVTYGDAHAADVIVAELRAAGVERALLFGGGEVNRLFYERGLVDELIVTICPLILGASAALPLVAPELPAAQRLALTASHAQGDLVFLTYNVLKT